MGSPFAPADMHHDLRSRSSSDDEKLNVHKSEFVLDDEIPDPDAHLSPEEKARIDKALLRKLDFKLIPWVRCSSIQLHASDFLTISLSAHSSVSRFLPRSYQHW